MKDHLYISVHAGKGGDGIVHWQHFPFKPKAGPDGGDGGKGGNIYIRSVRDVFALSMYRNKQIISAEDGGIGMRQEKKGHNGEDVEVVVPVGSIVINLQTNERFYFSKEDQKEVIAVGGRGGFGNTYFKSSRETTPKRAVPGQYGQAYDLYINLKLIADVGFIGLPNAGKSTLLNILTRAQARVGAYPFTTLHPNLGVFYGLVFADIPGLIEGSAIGKGLGHSFLKHIQSTRFLVHLVSLESKDPFKDYEIVRDELYQYNKSLLEKPEIVVLTKSDVVNTDHIEKILKLFSSSTQVISMYDESSIRNLQTYLSSSLQNIKDQPFKFEDKDVIANTPI